MAHCLSGSPLSRRNIDDKYARGFEGMTEEAVPLEALLETREAIITTIVGEMPERHRAFLLSFKQGDPDWAALGLEKAAELPAVQWKLHNLNQLTSGKRADLIDRLKKVLPLT